MENEELLLYIQKLSTNLESNNTLLYEIAFVKIYVKFEKFLSLIFTKYCLGQESAKGYKPRRKLEFKDDVQLKAILKNDNRSYIDYLKKIESLSKHIFEDNPFSIIFETSDSSLFDSMIILRNYIVHESYESRKKFEDTCIHRNDSTIEAGDYLLNVKRGTNRTNYDIFIEKIKQISELILDFPGIN